MQQTPPPSRDADADRLIRSLVVIGRAAKGGLTANLDRGAQWLLTVINDHGPQRLTQLANACGLDGSTVSRHVRRLEEGGLVSRTPDPEDGRAQVIGTTPSGDALVEATRAERRAMIADRLADWSPDDVATLTRLLSRLAEQIEARHHRTQS